MRDALENPLGVGFWAELPVFGYFSHHELIRVAVEQGFFGLAALLYLWRQQWKLICSTEWSKTRECEGIEVVQAFTVAMMCATVISLPGLFFLRFNLLYWTLVGLLDGLLVRAQWRQRLESRMKDSPASLVVPHLRSAGGYSRSVGRRAL